MVNGLVVKQICRRSGEETKFNGIPSPVLVGLGVRRKKTNSNLFKFCAVLALSMPNINVLIEHYNRTT